MDLLRKQIYELYFNEIGNTLRKEFEKTSGKKRTKISNLIKCVNEMYMYTNHLENELLVKEHRESYLRSDKIRAIQRARKAEKKLK
jgi:hypothetical protein